MFHWWLWIQIPVLTNINYAILSLILIFTENKFNFHKKTLILRIIDPKNIKWRCWFQKKSIFTNNLMKNIKQVSQSWTIIKCKEKFMISPMIKSFKRKSNNLYINILKKWLMREFKKKNQKKIKLKIKLAKSCF